MFIGDCRLSVRLLPHDVPANHHGVVLMHHVVAMHHVPAEEVAEPEEAARRLVRTEAQNILAGDVERLRRVPVTVENLELLEMDVHRVRPASGGVGNGPYLARALFGVGRYFGDIGQLSVDGPCAIAAVEVEGP